MDLGRGIVTCFALQFCQSEPSIELYTQESMRLGVSQDVFQLRA